MLETDASGNVTAENVYAPDGLVAREAGFASVGAPIGGLNGTNGLSGGTFIRIGETQYAFDPEGNVAQRLDSAGDVLSSSVYDAYGNESSTASPTDPFGYHAQDGYYADRETGLLYCQNRYYDPGAGRWVTRDPIGANGGINLYAYCASGPIGAADPQGLEIIVLAGGDQRELIEAQLNLLRTPGSPTAQMMRDYDSSDKPMFIDVVPRTKGPMDAQCSINFDYFDQRGGGRHLFYDPKHTGYSPQGDGGANIPFPPDVVLAHELGHRDPKDPSKPKRKDPPRGSAVGPNDNVGQVENPYRKWRKLPRRAYYF